MCAVAAQEEFVLVCKCGRLGALVITKTPSDCLYKKGSECSPIWKQAAFYCYLPGDGYALQPTHEVAEPERSGWQGPKMAVGA